MKIELNLTKAEAEAVMRAELTIGYGVRRSKALESAEAKLHEAVGTANPCPDCGAVTTGAYPDEHRSGYGDIANWCPRHPTVIAVKADEKRRGVYDPEEWGLAPERLSEVSR